MPINACVIQWLDKSDSDTPARQIPATDLHPPTEALEALIQRLGDAYHGKSKRWGRFRDASATSTDQASSDEDAPPWQDDDGDNEASGEAPKLVINSCFPTDLEAFVVGNGDLLSLANGFAEQLARVIDAHLPVGGHLIMVDQQQGETRTLFMVLVHHRDGFVIDGDQQVAISGQINHTQMSLAARINLSQWQQGGESSQYLSLLAERGGRKLADDMQALLGVSDGIDPKSETRTLLKAFSDYVESEDMAEEASREKTDALIDYANDQASRGETITLAELSALVDEDNPHAFFDHIRNADYGLSAEIPPDKRTLNQFRRFTGRAEGVSISFDSHLLGNSIEYDVERDRLIIKKLPAQLKEQLQKR